ncbi:MAG: hypothetical protein M1820_010205 [Bogoriella megaspora]|nr:MAG: hypothetical protein M1820_010205 [Bogoriella megaspora]
MPEPVALLGTTLEGGGQLLRIAVGAAALTCTPISIKNIRGNRKGAPGLKQQHLTCVQWLAYASNAKTTGVRKKSINLSFSAESLAKSSVTLSDHEHIDIGSPGSISLILQAILPFLIFSPTKTSQPRSITIKGGSNVDLSPSYEYVEQVLFPTLSLIGLPAMTASFSEREWRQTNQGTGSVTYLIQSLRPGAHLPAFTLKDRGPVTNLHATIFAPTEWQGHLETVFRAKVEEIMNSGRLLITSHTERQDNNIISFQTGTGGLSRTIYVLLVAHTTTGHRLGRDRWFSKSTPSSFASRIEASASKAKSGSSQQSSSRKDLSEDLESMLGALTRSAEELVEDLMAEVEHGGCVDEFMRDQLVIYQALAKGKSFVDGGREEGSVEVEHELEDREAVEDVQGIRTSKKSSLHTQTAEWVCEEVLGARFNGEGECEGVGWMAGVSKAI